MSRWPPRRRRGRSRLDRGLNTLKRRWYQPWLRADEVQEAKTSDIVSRLELVLTASRVLGVLVADLEGGDLWQDEVGRRLEQCSSAADGLRSHRAASDREGNFLASIQSHLISYDDGTLMVEAGLKRGRLDMISRGANTVTRAAAEIRTLSLLLQR